MERIIIVMCFLLMNIVSVYADIEVRISDEVTAGVSTNLILKDIDPSVLVPNENLRIELEPAGEVTPEMITPSSFINGVAMIRIKVFAAGERSILIKDKNGRIIGKSKSIDVKAGEVANLNLSIKDELRAGQNFMIELSVSDGYGNPISDYANKSRGVRLETASGMKLVPDFVPSEKFVSGIASLLVRYDKAGEETINALDVSNNTTSEPFYLTVKPGDFDYFSVKLQSVAEVNSEIPVEILAVDRNGNRVDKDMESAFYIQFGNAAPTSIEKILFNKGLGTTTIRVMSDVETQHASPLQKKETTPPELQYVYHLIKTGNIDQAIKESKKYIEKHPDDVEVMNLINRLEKLKTSQ